MTYDQRDNQILYSYFVLYRIYNVNDTQNQRFGIQCNNIILCMRL